MENDGRHKYGYNHLLIKGHSHYTKSLSSSLFGECFISVKWSSIIKVEYGLRISREKKLKWTTNWKQRHKPKQGTHKRHEKKWKRMKERKRWKQSQKDDKEATNWHRHQFSLSYLLLLSFSTLLVPHGCKIARLYSITRYSVNEYAPFILCEFHNSRIIFCWTRFLKSGLLDIQRSREIFIMCECWRCQTTEKYERQKKNKKMAKILKLNDVPWNETHFLHIIRNDLKSCKIFSKLELRLPTLQSKKKVIISPFSFIYYFLLELLLLNILFSNLSLVTN